MFYSCSNVPSAVGSIIFLISENGKCQNGRYKVLEALAALKVDKSPGPDELCPRLLWEAKEEIAGALT